MSEEIKEMNPDDKNHKKDSDGYEKNLLFVPSSGK